VGVIRAGERSGDLPGAFARLSAQLEREEELRNRLLSAAIYPILLGVAGGIAVCVLPTEKVTATFKHGTLVVEYAGERVGELPELASFDDAHTLLPRSTLLIPKSQLRFAPLVSRRCRRPSKSSHSG
jgi:hypothetical protein